MFFASNCFKFALSAALLLGQPLNAQATPVDAFRSNLARNMNRSVGQVDSSNGTSGAQPFYAIAHHVLTAQGALDAISHGANAIEMDMTAWKEGWWADHDGTLTSYGDTARKMFETIAEQRKAGKTLNFVWLDIKNPDYCDPDDENKWQCSIEALRDLAREILEPQGVRVLYGFYNNGGKAYGIISSGLDANEAVDIDGEWTKVQQQFSESGPSDKSKRIMSYGDFVLPYKFGDCTESDYYTCTELRQGAASHDFGKVFGWTSTEGESWYVDRLLGDAGVDGIIYGYAASYYHDSQITRAAAQDVFNWLAENPDRRYLATQKDSPW